MESIRQVGGVASWRCSHWIDSFNLSLFNMYFDSSLFNMYFDSSLFNMYFDSSLFKVSMDLAPTKSANAAQILECERHWPWLTSCMIKRVYGRCMDLHTYIHIARAPSNDSAL